MIVGEGEIIGVDVIVCDGVIVVVDVTEVVFVSMSEVSVGAGVS